MPKKTLISILSLKIQNHFFLNVEFFFLYCDFFFSSDSVRVKGQLLSPLLISNNHYKEGPGSLNIARSLPFFCAISRTPLVFSSHESKKKKEQKKKKNCWGNFCQKPPLSSIPPQHFQKPSTISPGNRSTFFKLCFKEAGGGGR